MGFEAVLRWKFIALNDIWKKKMSQINNQSSYHKKLEKEQDKPTVSRGSKEKMKLKRQNPHQWLVL